MKPKLLPALLATGVSIYTVVVVGIYAWHLKALPTSTDPAGWGQLGDYIGGLLNPVFALVNVVLVAYIALSLERSAERERTAQEESSERIQNSVDLHREWNSEAVYRSRNLAGRLLESHPNSTLQDIEKMESNEKVAHAWIVVGFFQRLALMVQHDKVHQEMTVELFGELFFSWWILAFEKQLTPCGWDASTRIDWLKQWLVEHTTADQRKPWIERAEAERAQKLAGQQAEQQSEPPSFDH